MDQVYKSSPESIAIIERMVAEAPRLNRAQLSRLSAITGFVVSEREDAA